MQAAALEAAKSYEKEALNRLRLMSIMAAELEIKGKRPAGNAALVGSDEQYEDYPVSMV
jgi:COP9 signalosome complex subunit 1